MNRLRLAKWASRYQVLRAAIQGKRRAAAAPVTADPVAAAIRENRFDVVRFPIIPWDFRFQRPQQLLCRLAAAGHRTFYVDSSLRSSGEPVTFRAIRDGVMEASLRGPALNLYTDVMDTAALEALFESLDVMRRTHGLSATASIVDLPFWGPLAIRARETFGWPIIYDCMDDHAGFEGMGSHVDEQETALLRAADLVVVSSGILEQKARQHSTNVLVAPNACDFEHFAGRPAADATRAVVGYYGAISEWFDTNLLADVAERRRDWSFVLIGHVMGADVTRLAALPNVRLVGEVPYPDLPKWLATFDVTVLPFKRIPLTEATNPVKVYETLAAGKPVVSVPLPELQHFAGLVRLASTAPQFEREIAKELDTPGARAARARRAFAGEHTWSDRAALIEPAIRRTFPRVSIVVVTHDRLDLTRLCLASLLTELAWPCYEIVVVDNASVDGTADYLRQLEANTPQLRVLVNTENRGLPAANNQALREVSGDYIILLNNDAVVTRGSLATLIRHLHRDRALGLVGSVTNDTGNEARIQVGYTDLGDLAAWSRGWMHDHDGQLFDIPVLAMFCVAMRRETFQRVGFLDERFGIGMFEDDDYTRRVRDAGYRVMCARDSYVHHWRRAAFGRMPDDEYQQLLDRNRRAFEEKWGVAWTPHAYAPGTPFTD